LEGSAITGMMIPDILTPGQYYDGVRADDACFRPIKRLMLAVLEDAMRCYQAYAKSRNGAHRRLFVEAEAWLMDRRADGAFSCPTICDTLGIDPACLREGLRRWRLQLLDGMSPRRLARRSPVTRAGRISTPLKRRRRGKASVPAAGHHGVAAAFNLDGDSFGNGATHVGGMGSGLAHGEPAYDVVASGGAVENVDEDALEAEVGLSASLQEAAPG
jgi:hypothetical protein